MNDCDFARSRSGMRAIRAARLEAGELVGDVYRMRALEARNMTREDLKLAANYQVGDVVEYHRASKSGIRAGDRGNVLNVNRDKNLVTVMREVDGKVIEYNPKRTGISATVYEPTIRELQTGDRIQVTRSLKAEKIANRTRGTLE